MRSTMAAVLIRLVTVLILMYHTTFIDLTHAWSGPGDHSKPQ